MLKTIKTTKQLRLDELIKYVWEHDGSPLKRGMAVKFYTKDNKIVTFEESGEYSSDNWFDPDDLFTIEVEEEITEDTMFDTLVSVYPPLGYSSDCFVDVYTNQTINGVINDDKAVGVETEHIYALIDNKLELIWESDNQ